MILETGFPIWSGMTKRTSLNHRETLHPPEAGSGREQGLLCLNGQAGGAVGFYISRRLSTLVNPTLQMDDKWGKEVTKSA